MDTIDISLTADALGLNHDTYSASPLLMADIRRLIETGVHPPTKRSGMMQPIISEEDVYTIKVVIFKLVHSLPMLSHGRVRIAQTSRCTGKRSSPAARNKYGGMLKVWLAGEDILRSATRLSVQARDT